MYEMMEEKYSKNAENCTKDFIISIIRRSSQNKANTNNRLLK